MNLLMKQLEPSKTVLDEANAVSLLLFLLDKNEKGEEVAATDLLAVVKSYNRIKALADDFKDLGLVDVKIIKERNVTFQYSLTAKGKEVAEQLRHVVELISSAP